MPAHLVVLDVDSTLITAEVIELLAERAGSRAEVAAVTDLAMRGEIDFAESLKQRVATLAGLPTSVFADVLDEIEFTPGAQALVATFQQRGWTAALVSGGFVEVVEPLAAKVNITLFRANRLEAVDGILTGRTVGPVVDSAAKAHALEEFAGQLNIPIAHTIAIGDGANDLGMMAAAGLGIAFNAKPKVQQLADVAVNAASLEAVLDVIEY
ncbi:MAG: phosphoserine phosphatase SerB [Actinobacteria bacterium HGW-Actinobacteria-4]|nr:MAG: phosphoserine phosphatase SerB [Actinobacteria bacterium HGW-Actinobacteria-4]